MRMEDSLSTLQKKQTDALDALSWFRSRPPEGAPDMDPSALQQLKADAGLTDNEPVLSPETERLVQRIIKASEDLRAQWMRSEIELLERVQAEKQPCILQGPWGISLAAFPIMVRGQTAHVLTSGPLRTKPLSKRDAQSIAKHTAWTPEQVETVFGKAPLLSEPALEVIRRLLRENAETAGRALTFGLQNEELTRRLSQAERAHSFSVLSGGIAHHFNSLLSIVLGYSSFILNREKLTHEASDALYKISEAAQRGRRLTEEMLAMLGHEEEETEVLCRLHAIVESTLSLLRTQFGGRVRVDMRLEAESDTILAPMTALRQVVFNLLTNAVDGMPEGGVLTVRTDNETVPGEGGSPQGYLRLEVADSGGALPRDFGMDAPSADVADSEIKQRMALKLSNVYGIIGRLEGTMLLSSEPGIRTSIRVLLPLAEGNGGAQPVRTAQPRLAAKKIWVVDDDPIFRQMCRQLLGDEGHEVTDFPGGREMQQAIRTRKERPELFIIDFSMPECNGLQLCEWLRHEDLTAPVILVSGFAATQPDIRKALRMKKTFLLQKPFTSRDLADAVTVALGETLIGDRAAH